VQKRQQATGNKVALTRVWNLARITKLAIIPGRKATSLRKTEGSRFLLRSVVEYDSPLRYQPDLFVEWPVYQVNTPRRLMTLILPDLIVYLEIDRLVG
jgi:hypothetical protein